VTLLTRALRLEAREQRAFKFRLDDAMKALREDEKGATYAVLESCRMRAHETETALQHEAEALDRYARID